MVTPRGRNQRTPEDHMTRRAFSLIALLALMLPAVPAMAAGARCPEILQKLGDDVAGAGRFREPGPTPHKSPPPPAGATPPAHNPHPGPPGLAFHPRTCRGRNSPRSSPRTPRP